MKQILRHQETVHNLLCERPTLRDNDNALCIAFWHNECKEKNLFFHLFIIENLTPVSSITRARRLVQKKYAYTRGLKYKKRINQLEEKVRKEIIEDGK